MVVRSLRLPVELEQAVAAAAKAAEVPKTTWIRQAIEMALAVQAEDELVGLVVVGEEARDGVPVHLVRAARREARVAVQRVRARPHLPEQPRPVEPHVAEDALGLGASRPEEPGRERVRHHEVPVAAEPRLGHRVVRPLAGEERHGDEQRAVGEPPLRTGDLMASGTISGAESGSEGSMIELFRGERFLEDGDEVALRGRAANGVGLGEVRGRVLPARL